MRVRNASRRAPRRGADAQDLCLMKNDLCVALYTNRLLQKTVPATRDTLQPRLVLLLCLCSFPRLDLPICVEKM